MSTAAVEAFHNAQNQYSSGDLNAALKTFKLALRLFQKQRPNDHAKVAACLGSIGTIHRDNGNLDEALKHYRAALKAKQKAGAGPMDIAASYNNLGMISRDKGDLEEALKFWRRSLEMKEQASPRSLPVAKSLNNIASLLHETGRIDEAIHNQERALSILESESPDSLNVATSMLNLGALYFEQGKARQAYATYEKSRKIFDKLSLSNSHPTKITYKYRLGEVALKSKQYPSALKNAAFVLQYMPEYKFAYVLKAKALEGMKKYKEALSAYDMVLMKSPNFADAHVGRVQLRGRMVLATTTSSELRSAVATMQHSYKDALAADPTATDGIDEDLKQRFTKELAVDSSKPRVPFSSSNDYRRILANTRQTVLQRSKSKTAQQQRRAVPGSIGRRNMAVTPTASAVRV